MDDTKALAMLESTNKESSVTLENLAAAAAGNERGSPVRRNGR